MIKKHADESVGSLIEDLVPRGPGDVTVVFGFESGNGPALGGLRLREPVEIRQPGMKKIKTRFRGVGKSSKHCHLNNQKYFTTNGRVDPFEIQRVDPEWIFQRGGTGLPSALDGVCVCIVGCGSLGAHVTKLLAYSGARNFLLVDPDILSMDNIGRHLLGGSEVGQSKVEALKSHLQNHFPGLLSIQAEKRRWQAVMAEDSDAITGCGLIISTIGDWDAEAALNHSFNTTMIFPPEI